MLSHYTSFFRSWLLSGSLVLATGIVSAQVSGYTFSQTVGTWTPITGGNYVGYNLIDDAAFVDPADLIGFSGANFGPGFPIGFDFTFNGVVFDRFAISPEGWISLGQSSLGGQAVYLPISTDEAYAPLANASMGTLNPILHHRIVAFAADLKAQSGGPMRVETFGTAPNRTCVVQWNNMGLQMAGSSLNFQIRLNEGGGVPSAQTVQVVYGTMTPGNGPAALQVGLGGSTVADYNARAEATAPYDWTASADATNGSATCGFSNGNTTLPSGLTYTWTPMACTVGNVAFTGLSVTANEASGTVSWSGVPGATSYDYIITAGSATDPPLANANNLTGTSVVVSGIPADGVFYVYVRASCNGILGGWGAGVLVDPGSVIAIPCGEAPVQQALCYGNNQQYNWLYTSSSGAALRAEFATGFLDGGDQFKVYDGPNAQSPLLFTGGSGDALAGQQITSTGGDMYMMLSTDATGSCETQPWYTSWDWRVGCLDCDPILANFQLSQDCDAGTFQVTATVFSLGSATVASLTNTGGAPAVAITAPGAYVSGPFPLDSTVVVTVENPDNAFCSTTSSPMVNGPCAIQSCGPDTYTYCYTNNDASQWLYQSADNERIGMRFRSGTAPSPDGIQVFDGSDPDLSPPLYIGNNGGDLRNLLLTTSTGNTDNAIWLAVTSNTYGSCADGGAQPWEYVVACYDGCTAPAATFMVVDDCDAQQFSVEVEVTAIGSTGSVNITNTGGASSVSATAIGTYTVGPFPLATLVRLEVEGASALCSSTSQMLTDNCGNIGIAELVNAQLGIRPNPSTGHIVLHVPTGMRGPVRVAVLDVTGRTVHSETFSDPTNELNLDLAHLSGGNYTVLVTNAMARAVAKLSIVR